MACLCAGQSLHLARCFGAAHGSPPDIREHFDDPGYGTLRTAQVSLVTRETLRYGDNMTP